MSAASSQYYRSADTHSHYPNFPANNNEHMYALAASWHPDPNHASYAGPPSAPLPPFLHYSNDGVDSVDHPTSSAQAWPTNYSREDVPGWDHVVNDDAYTSRPGLQFDAAEGNLPAPPRTTSEASRHYHHHQQQQQQQQQQQTLNGGPELPSSPRSDAFRSGDALHDLRVASESPANALDPPFTNHVQGQHSFPRFSQPRVRIAPLHLNSSDQTLRPSTDAAWETGTELQTLESHHYSSHASNAIVPSHLATDRAIHTNPGGASWPVMGLSDVSAGPSGYQREQEEDVQWGVVQTIPNHGPYVHQHQPQISADKPVLLEHLRRPTRRKVAKVPSSFVERQEKLKVSKRKGPLAERQREKTHTMRKTKRICVRCRFYKSGCDEGDPCEKCEKITGHARSFREPCYREHLEDTSLVRRCNGREHQEAAEFLAYEWVHNSQLYKMELIWNLPGYGPIPNAPPMCVTFRPYSPRRGSMDVAASVWTNKDGELKTIEQPAYAIYDTADLVPAFERYFSSLQPAIEAWIFTRISQDEVARLTYTEVLRMRSVHGSKALDLAMRLQCLSVVSQGYGSVWNNNIPGIREYDYRRLGSSDYEAYDRKSYDRPLPGAMTHQMDVAAVKYLGKLEKELVKELAALIFKPKIKPWYELFLAFYVVFWNLEYIHHGANDYIKSKNGTLIENQVNNVVKSQIAKWEFAFPVLLYHWRCTLRGYAPFKLARENPDELEEKGHIDHEGFQYVKKISSLFDRRNPDRFQPPLTGFASMHYSMSSEYIVNLFKEAGA